MNLCKQTSLFTLDGGVIIKYARRALSSWRPRPHLGSVAAHTTSPPARPTQPPMSFPPENPGQGLPHAPGAQVQLSPPAKAELSQIQVCQG